MLQCHLNLSQKKNLLKALRCSFSFGIFCQSRFILHTPCSSHTKWQKEHFFQKWLSTFCGHMQLFLFFWFWLVLAVEKKWSIAWKTIKVQQTFWDIQFQSSTSFFQSSLQSVLSSQRAQQTFLLLHTQFFHWLSHSS